MKSCCILHSEFTPMALDVTCPKLQREGENITVKKLSVEHSFIKDVTIDCGLFVQLNVNMWKNISLEESIIFTNLNQKTIGPQDL